MNSNQLKIYLSVAKTLNFTQTAKELFISESTVSKNIASLERELGITLIKRKPHEVLLTAEGEYFLSRAQLLNKDLEETIAGLHANSEQKEVVVTLGVTNIAFEQAWLPLALRIAKEKYHIRFKLLSFMPGTAKDLKKMLTSNEADIVLLQSDYFASEKEITSTRFFRKGFSVLINNTDSLAQQRRVDIESLKNRKLLLWDSPFTSPIIEKLKLKLSKKPLAIKFERCSDYYALITLVRAGEYTGIIPSLMYDRKNQDLSYVPLNYVEEIDYCANYLEKNAKKRRIQNSLAAIEQAVAVTQSKW